MLALQAVCIAASEAGDEPWHADICQRVNNHTSWHAALLLQTTAPEEEPSWTASGYISATLNGGCQVPCVTHVVVHCT